MSNHWFLYHTSEDPFAFPAGPGALKLRLFVPAGQHLSCTVVHSDRYDSRAVNSRSLWRKSVQPAPMRFMRR